MHVYIPMRIMITIVAFLTVSLSNVLESFMMKPTKFCRCKTFFFTLSCREELQGWQRQLGTHPAWCHSSQIWMCVLHRWWMLGDAHWSECTNLIFHQDNEWRHHNCNWSIIIPFHLVKQFRQNAVTGISKHWHCHCSCRYFHHDGCLASYTFVADKFFASLVILRSYNWQTCRKWYKHVMAML